VLHVVLLLEIVRVAIVLILKNFCEDALGRDVARSVDRIIHRPAVDRHASTVDGIELPFDLGSLTR